MKSNAYRNFAAYFPYVANSVVSYNENDIGLSVELDNGERYMYDDIERTIRRLPNDSMNLSANEFKNEFGKRLHKIMRMKNISQRELSEKTGITQPMFSNYISGKTVPSFYMVDKIAKALNCSADIFRYMD